MSVLLKGHYDVKLSKNEMQRITSWIDINAVYYGRYESYYPGRNPLLLLPDGKIKNKTIMRAAEVRNADSYLKATSHLYNFTRPEKSHVLTLMKDEKSRAQALGWIKEAVELLKKYPREDQINEERSLSVIDLYNKKRLAATKAENKKSLEAAAEIGRASCRERV